MSEPKPMDPERLKSLFGLLRLGNVNEVLSYSGDQVSELLADRDHWEAEAKRYRDLLECCDVSHALVRKSGLSLKTALAGYREGHEDDANPEWPDDVEADDERAAYICNITPEPMECMRWLLDNAERLDEMAAQEAS